MYKMKQLLSFFKNNETPRKPFQCKVIVKGTNINNDKPICIVKVGSFSNSAEGLTAAIKAGSLDRYGVDFPDITVASMKLLPVSRKGDICTYSATLEQVHEGELSKFHVVASYRPLPENA